MTKMEAESAQEDRHYEERRHWHIDKTLNISHLLATFVIAGSLFAYASHMDRRVTMLEEQIKSQSVSQQDAREAVRDLGNEVKAELRALRTDLMRIVSQSQNNKP